MTQIPTPDGPPRTADGAQRTADGAQRTADGTQRTADGTQRTADGTQRTASPAALTAQHARLLAGGAAAGPLFLTVWFVQGLTRAGFDLSRHPLSLLSLGDLGWIQIANFAVTGALYAGAAVGMRRALHPGRASVWGPLLIGVFGAGLIVAGVFLTDAGAGFPPGAPAGRPAMTWHGALHELGFVAASLSWPAACLVFARRFAARRQWAWVAACVTAAVAVVALVAWPDLDGFTVRATIASVIEFGGLSALAVQVRRSTGLRILDTAAAQDSVGTDPGNLRSGI